PSTAIAVKSVSGHSNCVALRAVQASWNSCPSRDALTVSIFLLLPIKPHNSQRRQSPYRSPSGAVSVYISDSRKILSGDLALGFSPFLSNSQTYGVFLLVFGAEESNQAFR